MADGNGSREVKHFKGVSFYTKRNLWFARIKIDGKAINLGYFKTAIEAALAYDCAAKVERRKVNFPGQETPAKIAHKVNSRLTKRGVHPPVVRKPFTVSKSVSLEDKFGCSIAFAHSMVGV